MRRLLILAALGLCLALPAPQYFRPDGCDYASLANVPKTVPGLGPWKPSWEKGILRASLEVADATGRGDSLKATVSTLDRNEGGGAVHFSGHAEVEYSMKAGRPPAEGDLEVQMSQRNGKTQLFFKRAFLDGLTLGDFEMVGIPRAVKTETGNHRTASLLFREIVGAIQERHKVGSADEVYSTEVVNLPTNLKILGAELRWKKANPGKPVPDSVRVAAFQESTVDKFIHRTLKDAGYELQMDASPLTGGRTESIGDYFVPTETRPTQRATDNRIAWEEFKAEMAKTDPDIAATLNDGTEIFARYSVKYNVTKKP